MASTVARMTPLRWFFDEKANIAKLEVFSMEDGSQLKHWIGNVYSTFGLDGTPRPEYDVGLRPALSEYPTVVVLSSWTEQRDLAISDMHSWMTRSKGGVKKCIVLVWEKIAVDSVQCTVEVYEPQLGDAANEEEDDCDDDDDDDGSKVIGGVLAQMEVMRLREDFVDHAQAIKLTVGEMFGEFADDLGLNSDRAYYLSIDNLRRWAEQAIKLDNWDPPDDGSESSSDDSDGHAGDMYRHDETPALPQLGEEQQATHPKEEDLILPPEDEELAGSSPSAEPDFPDIPISPKEEQPSITPLPAVEKEVNETIASPPRDAESPKVDEPIMWATGEDDVTPLKDDVPPTPPPEDPGVPTAEDPATEPAENEAIMPSPRHEMPVEPLYDEPPTPVGHPKENETVLSPLRADELSAPPKVDEPMVPPKVDEPMVPPTNEPKALPSPTSEGGPVTPPQEVQPAAPPPKEEKLDTTPNDNVPLVPSPKEEEPATPPAETYPPIEEGPSRADEPDIPISPKEEQPSITPLPAVEEEVNETIASPLRDAESPKVDEPIMRATGEDDLIVPPLKDDVPPTPPPEDPDVPTVDDPATEPAENEAIMPSPRHEMPVEPLYEELPTPASHPKENETVLSPPRGDELSAPPKVDEPMVPPTNEPKALPPPPSESGPVTPPQEVQPAAPPPKEERLDTPPNDIPLVLPPKEEEPVTPPSGDESVVPSTDGQPKEDTTEISPPTDDEQVAPRPNPNDHEPLIPPETPKKNFDFRRFPNERSLKGGNSWSSSSKRQSWVRQQPQPRSQRR